MKADTIVTDDFTNYPDLVSGDPGNVSKKSHNFNILLLGSVLHEGIGEVDIMVMVVENVGSEGTKPAKRVVRSDDFSRGTNQTLIAIPKSEIKGNEERTKNRNLEIVNEGPTDKTAVFYGPVYSYYEFEVMFYGSYH